MRADCAVAVAMRGPPSMGGGHLEAEVTLGQAARRVGRPVRQAATVLPAGRDLRPAVSARRLALAPGRRLEVVVIGLHHHRRRASPIHAGTIRSGRPRQSRRRQL